MVVFYEWHPDFEDHVRDLLSQGIRTPQIDRFLESIGVDVNQAVITADVLDQARPLTKR